MTGSIFLEEIERNVSENGGTISIGVLRTGDLSGAVTIEYSVNPDSAAANIDYIYNANFVYLPAGVGRIVIDVPIVNDEFAEGLETFSVSLVSVNSGSLGLPRTTRVDIIDDEAPPAPPNPDGPSVSNYDVVFTPVSGAVIQPISIEYSKIDPAVAYVASKLGTIQTVNIQTGAPIATILDISAKVNSLGDRGLIDIALHPNLAANPYIYVSYVVDPPETAFNTGSAGADGDGNRFNYISRFTLDAATGYQSIVANSEVVLVGGAATSLSNISGGGALNFTEQAYAALPSSGIDQATGLVKQNFLKMDSTSHVGGSINFGTDGLLYVTTGDGTSYNFADPRTPEVQSLDSLNGKVLRIDPITGAGVASNPFATGDLNENRSKVYQLGLRNPFNSAIDANNRLFIGEVGWFEYEEINTGGAGANFGWPYFEGADGGIFNQTPIYRDTADGTAFYGYVANGAIAVTQPYRAFSHATADAGYQVQALLGASSIYTGGIYPEEFLNDYFFIDGGSGALYAVDTNDKSQLKFVTTYTAGGLPVHFSQGPDGYLYYADLYTNTIGRIEIARKPGAPIPAPETGFEAPGVTDVFGVRIVGTSRADTVDGQQSARNQPFATDLADVIRGNGGNDRLSGLAGNDKIYGDAGNDILRGGSGNDRLEGGSGNNTLYGDSGDDTYVLTGSRDTVVEFAGGGNDTVNTSKTLRLGANVENGTLTGRSGSALTGNELDNTLIGNGGANTIRGQVGNDIIRAGAGNDKIYGGVGVDYLAGQGGRDTFYFGSIFDAGNGAGGRDIIADFAPRTDRISLTGIDANVNSGGNQAFNFIGAGGFTGAAGQLNYFVEGGSTIVQGDTNGDFIADFQIELLNITNVRASDFML